MWRVSVGKDCPSPHRHTHSLQSTPEPMLIVNIWSALFCSVKWRLCCLLCTPQFQSSHYQTPIKTEIWRKARARCCSALAQIESDSLTHNMAPVMWLGQRGTLFLNSHIPKSEPYVQLRQTLRLLPLKRGAERAVLSPTLVSLAMLHALRRIEMMPLLNHNPLEGNCKHM